MNPWQTALIVALIAAAGSIVAANISSAHSRRNVRGRILSDLDIAEKLPKDSPVKKILTSYAESRALLLPMENHVRYLGILETRNVLATSVYAIGGTYLSEYPHQTLYYGFGGVLAFIVVWITQRRYRRIRHNLIQAYLKESDIAPSAEPAIEKAVKQVYYPWRYKSQEESK